MTERARAVTQNALDLLQERLRTAESPGDFLVEADAILADNAHLLRLPILVEAAAPLEPSQEPENARILYEAIGAMDRANAADGRLWTYLAFVTFRPYMERRWPLGNVRNWRSRVETRWLLVRSSRPRLVRHGIARLWWIAHLTYDAGMKQNLAKEHLDTYAYTRWVLANEDRVQAIFEREVGASPAVLVAAIDAMAAIETRSHSSLVKGFMKELTLASAYRDLDTLEPATLAEINQELISVIDFPQSGSSVELNA